MARPRWDIELERLPRKRKLRRIDDPEMTVRIHPSDAPYTIAVEISFDDDGPFVHGVAVRPRSWTGERTHVSPRDIQRLPLARIVSAALAAAATADAQEEKPSDVPGIGTIVYESGDGAESQVKWARQARRILVPRGRPRGDKSARFYHDLAKAYQGFAAEGLSPVKEIARRKRVSENTVHQWVYRARHTFGFLEASPRSKKKPDKEETDG